MDSLIPPISELMAFCDVSECFEWAQGLEAKYPQLIYDSGFYVQDDGTPVQHGWTHTEDGTIVDTTHGQFDSKIPILIAGLDHPLHGRYHSYESHHAPHCLLKKLGVKDQCLADGCSYDAS